jgi:hypothetical protein
VPAIFVRSHEFIESFREKLPKTDHSNQITYGIDIMGIAAIGAGPLADRQSPLQVALNPRLSSKVLNNLGRRLTIGHLPQGQSRQQETSKLDSAANGPASFPTEHFHLEAPQLYSFWLALGMSNSDQTRERST